MRHARRGFSLMEVLLATSILMGSTIVLVELANLGRKQAASAYHLTSAQLLCQAKLSEIVAGAGPAMMIEEQELEDAPGWFYSVEIQPLRSQRLVELKVSVFQQPGAFKRAERFCLVRWLPDTSLRTSQSAPSDRTLTSPRQPVPNQANGGGS